MNKTLRVGLIGFGTMGKNYAQMLYHHMVDGMTLAGVCCRSSAGRDLLAQQFPGVAVYGNIEEMEACKDDYDAVIIVTPHTTHVPLGIRMANLGKHILTDKPAGISAQEVRQLTQVCKQQGVALGVIFNNRRLPAFRKAKELLDSGILGKLHRAGWVCNSWYRSPAYHRSGTWRSTWKGECGGLMINQNPHYVDMWQWFFGMPQRVYADMAFGKYNDFLVDDAVDIQFSYDSGFHGTFVSATGEAPGVNRLEIWGSKGRMTVEDGKSLSLHMNQVDTEVFGETNREPFGMIPFEVKTVALEAPGNPYADVFSNFARHVLYREPLYADGLEGLKTTQLTNAIYVSGWEECRVTLPVAEDRFAAGLQKMQDRE